MQSIIATYPCNNGVIRVSKTMLWHEQHLLPQRCLKQLMRFWYLSHMRKSLFQTRVLAYQAGLKYGLSLHFHPYFVFASNDALASLRIGAGLLESSLLKIAISTTKSLVTMMCRIFCLSLISFYGVQIIFNYALFLMCIMAVSETVLGKAQPIGQLLGGTLCIHC